jgi:hypothetical protein
MTAAGIQIGRLPRIQADNSPHLARLRRNTAPAGLTALVVDMQMNLAQGDSSCPSGLAAFRL